MNDMELVSHFLRENKSAVTRVDAWIRTAAAPFRHRLGADWEDTLQEIRLEVLQLLRRDSFKGRARLKTYIWSIANHTCIDHLRKKAHWNTTTLETLQADPNSASPLDNIQRVDHNRLLLKVLQKVSPECRQLWRLVLDGLSYRQIGNRLKLNEGTVRVRVHRCRKTAIALRRRLDT